MISMKLQREHRRTAENTADELFECVKRFCGVGTLRVSIVAVLYFYFFYSKNANLNACYMDKKNLNEDEAKFQVIWFLKIMTNNTA